MAFKTHTVVSTITGFDIPARSADNQSIYDTRRKRRRLIDSIISHLVAIKDHEASYLANIPDNLQSGPAYESAELAIDNLDQAIDLLRDVY